VAAGQDLIPRRRPDRGEHPRPPAVRQAVIPETIGEFVQPAQDLNDAVLDPNILVSVSDDPVLPSFSG
jgi:hypothetical protein